jgi:chemotaxis protein MotA
MLFVVGLIVLILMVFGGFAITGGHLGPVLHAMPHEMLIIGGAAIGALLMGNSTKILKQVGVGLVRVVKGPKYKRQDYLDTIFLLSRLMRLLKSDGPVAVEPHVENPETSDIFLQYPRLLADSFFVHLVTDTIRLQVISSGQLNMLAVEEIIDNAIKTHHHNSMKATETLQTLSDALPALGIVAAVLGVVKTMGSIDKPPSVLGAMIGSALVGTFLGVLLSYGIVGPCASRLKQIEEEDAELYHVVKQIILASMKDNPQPMVIEAARTGISHHNQPSFSEVFDGLRAAR